MPSQVYVLSLVMMVDNAPEGIGWYVQGIENTGEEMKNIAPTKISFSKAEEIGAAFSNVIQIQENQLSPFELVKHGTDGAKKAAQEELEKAEEIAKKIPSLRNVLKELG